MISSVLIANRGEIAGRIVQACRELGVRSVAVCSSADEDSLPVQLADEAICIGAAASSESYLRVDRLIAAAEIADVDAIHPGYGFLAEDPHLAEVCQDCNISFIGPSAEAIRRMGNKSEARKTMQASGVPVTPGSDGIVESEETALELAKDMGYPVMIKASAGGGGKGMRVVHNNASLVHGFHAARREAEMAFGSPDVYIEKFVENPRHVEVQVLADEHGNTIHLNERDCSLQRRHQKLIEESPSPALNPDLRASMTQAAVRAAEAVEYKNAGTVEFLLGNDDNFYFMEMNTRIQVEHPVTEMITGVDLVKEQIRVASGETLRYSQDDIQPRGHAIEVRVNAENALENFAPSPGDVTFCVTPGGPGVRIDSHVYSGYRIPPHYDSMIGKLVVWGRDRDEALRRARRAINEYVIDGVHTTLDFAAYLLSREEMVQGDYDTGFVQQVVAEGLPYFGAETE